MRAPKPVYQDDSIALYRGDFRNRRSWLRKQGIDATIWDPPYSSKTHGGHDSGRRRKEVTRESIRSRPIDFAAWTPEVMRAACELVHDVTKGWIVTMTDHLLAPEVDGALTGRGRYVFAPMPYVAPGSRVRLAGDGPALWAVWCLAGHPAPSVAGTALGALLHALTGPEWTEDEVTHLVVARPRGLPYIRWGALPGSYVLPPGMRGNPATRGEHRIVGGKEEWIMRRLIDDYTKPGDLILDPCAGAGTTLVAARDMRRRAIGFEIDRETIKTAKAYLEATERRPKAIDGDQLTIFAGCEKPVENL